MRYRGELTIPAATPESQPATATVGLTYGRITEVGILIPAGHSGLTHVKVMYHEAQIFPSSPERDFTGDDHLISFPDSYPIHDEPFSVRLVGWSPGATLEHTLYVDFSVEPEAPMQPIYAASVALPGASKRRKK